MRSLVDLSGIVADRALGEAGIFTGQLKRDNEVEKGSRFDPNTAQGKNYRQRYCASSIDSNGSRGRLTTGELRTTEQGATSTFRRST